MDEFTRECLASEVASSIKQYDVIELLRYLFLVRGCPVYLRSDNGSQFTAEAVKRFLKELGVRNCRHASSERNPISTCGGLFGLFM